LKASLAMPTGERTHMDKKYDEMDDEEKATFNLFDAADGDYDELEDDFVFIANEGMPLLVPEEDD